MLWITVNSGPNGTFFQLMTPRQGIKGNFCLGFGLFNNETKVFRQEIVSWKKDRKGMSQISIGNNCGFVSDY